MQQVENCGFVDWVDGEWPDTAKNAISRLWGMYEEQKSARIDERYENAKLVKELSVEKDKVEKKYTSMVQSVSKFIDDTGRILFSFGNSLLFGLPKEPLFLCL